MKSPLLQILKHTSACHTNKEGDTSTAKPKVTGYYTVDDVDDDDWGMVVVVIVTLMMMMTTETMFHICDDGNDDDKCFSSCKTF